MWDGKKGAMEDTKVFAWTMRRMELLFIDGKSWIGLREKCKCGAHVEMLTINLRFRVEART